MELGEFYMSKKSKSGESELLVLIGIVMIMTVLVMATIDEVRRWYSPPQAAPQELLDDPYVLYQESRQTNQPVEKVDEDLGFWFFR